MIDKKMRRKLATASTIASFFIAGITGLLIFFELAPGSIRAVHEWMSIVFLIGAGCHILVNLTMFQRYFSSSKSILVSVTLLGMLVFASSYDDIYVADRSYELLLNSPVQDIADLQNISDQDIRQWLQHHGLNKSALTQSVAEIAQETEKEEHHILESLIAGSFG